MTKKIVFAFVFVFVFMSQAYAQEGAGAADAGLATCVKECQNAATAVKKTASKKKARNVALIRLAARLKALETAARNGDASLRIELAALGEAVNRLAEAAESKKDHQVDRLALANEDEKIKASLNGLAEKIDRLEQRLNSRYLEHQLGWGEAFVGLVAPNGAVSYMTSALGPRLTLSLSGDGSSRVFLETAFLASGWLDQIGVRLKSGLGFDLGPSWTVELAVAGVWADMGLSASRAIFVVGEVGVACRIWRKISLGLNVPLGFAFRAGPPALVTGAIPQLAYRF